jgi:H+/Cl- antiporter ClcA
VYYSLTHWHDFRLKLFGEGIVIGLFAGLIVVLFRFLLGKGDELRSALYVYLQTAPWYYTVLWGGVLLVTAYLLGRIAKAEPMVSGSGIPQVKGVIFGFMRMRWPSILINKFLGGVLAIGAGLSLGREGPSIQLGSAIAQGLSRMLGRTRMEERYLLTSGASAGLSAAFGAPLAGVIFSLEEMHKNFSPTVLLSAVAASLTADVVAQHFFGFHPMFNFTGIPIIPIRFYGIIGLLGVFIGFLGVAFNSVLIKTLNVFEKSKLSAMWKAAVPLAIAGILGFVLPQVLSGGNDLVNVLVTQPFALKILWILLLGKFFFTMVSYGSGVPGGIFLPMLVIGALAGSIYGHVMIGLGVLNTMYGINMIILAMAALFSAVVRAPITGSILIMEMTGSFNHLFALIVVSMIAYLVADIAKTKPIYEELLERALEKKGRIPNTTSEKRMVMELAVAMGSKLDGKQVKHVKWPAQCLLVSIKRGEDELVPKGDTRIAAGDYLYILANAEQAQQVHMLTEECLP